MGVSGGGGGGQNVFAYSGCCWWISSYTLTPEPIAGVPGPNLWAPSAAPPPPFGPLPVRTWPSLCWVRCFSDTCKLFKIPLLQKPICRPWDWLA